MHWVPVTKLLILITIANGAPVIAQRIWGEKGSQPIDFDSLWYDERPVFGPSKTFRGLICSLAATAVIAPMLRLDWKIGLVAGAAAMVGDLLSSFTKRRFGLTAGARATGLDQIPESLIPALLCAEQLDLSWLDVLLVACAFFVGELIFSRVLYRLHIRRRPY